jgi:hypothetical protein
LFLARLGVIGAFQGAGELMADMPAVVGHDIGRRLDGLVLVDGGGDAGHRRQVIGAAAMRRPGR